MAPHHFPHTLEPLLVAVQKINIKLCLSFTDTLTPRNLRLGFLRSGRLAVSELPGICGESEKPVRCWMKLVSLFIGSRDAQTANIELSTFGFVAGDTWWRLCALMCRVDRPK